MHGDEAERLAGSVLLQAINDAGLRSGTAADLRSIHPLDRAEAISFLTSPVGEWKKAREFWCGICGKDAEHLRCWAARKLGQPLDPPSSPPRADEPIQLFHPVARPEMRRMTKRSVILNLINRPEGVSPDEIMERCDCSHGTAQVALRQLRHPLGLKAKRGDDGRYRLVNSE